jgi:hypothetical protein
MQDEVSNAYEDLARARACGTVEGKNLTFAKLSERFGPVATYLYVETDCVSKPTNIQKNRNHS